MQKLLSMGLAMVGVMMTAAAATAGTWAEVGDAGDLPATAQETVGAGPLTSITGTLSSELEHDMYCIRIVDPDAFMATTGGTPGTLIDSQLFLFDAAGMGIYGNDDIVTFINRRSTLPAGHLSGPMAPGLYYLAISGWNRDPVSPGGLIFPATDGDPVEGPTGPGGGMPISGWAGFTAGADSRGTYEIHLVGAEFCAVPEPGSLALLSLGAPLLAAYRRRRRNQAE